MPMGEKKVTVARNLFDRRARGAARVSFARRRIRAIDASGSAARGSRTEERYPRRKDNRGHSYRRREQVAARASNDVRFERGMAGRKEDRSGLARNRNHPRVNVERGHAWNRSNV